MKVMKEEIFNQMSTKEKAAYVSLHGTYQAYRTLGVFVVKLFQLNDFYVEIYFNSKMNTVGWIQTFKSDRYLEPYLEHINIEF
jgi:hypothetical protein